jgi:hypothetical protein
MSAGAGAQLSFSQTLFEGLMKTNSGPFTCLETSFVAHAAGTRCCARSHNSACVSV